MTRAATFTLRWAWLVVLLLGPLAGPAAAAPPRKAETATTRAALETLLRKSSMPPGAGELAGIGRNVDELLVAIARDPALELPLRARAVGALGRVPTPASRAFLTNLVEAPEDALAPVAAQGPRGKRMPAPDAGPASDDVTRTLLRRAAVSLGWIGGSMAPMTLGPLLGHSDADVRADAAVGLALTRLPEAARLLRARLPIEPDARVRGHIARQLNVIEAALGAPAGATPPATPKTPVGPPPRAQF